MPRLNPLLATVVDPPVAVAKQWVAGRTFDAALPLLDLSQAAPSEPPAAELRAHLAGLVTDPTTSTYAPALGLPHVRERVAAHRARHHGGAVPGDHVMVTSGCNQAFCLAIGALCAPGDDVVLVSPWYFNHEMWLRANGITVTTVHARPDDGMVPRLDDLDAAISERTRAVVLVTPNNPCGVEYPPDLVHAAYDTAAARGIVLVLDETYDNFRSSTEPAHGLFARPDWPSTLVHLFSFSKVFSLPGYRVGSLIADPALLAAAVKLADCETIGAPRIGQEAVAFGIDHLDGWVAEQRAAMRARVDAFDTAVRDGAPSWYVESSGAYFAYVRHPFDGVDAEIVARRLADEQALLTIPGGSFGPGQQQHLRLAFGNAAVDAMPEVARRLAATN